MFFERIVELCNKKGIYPNTMCSELGLSNAVATKWKKGPIPHYSTLKRIADYFDVSTDYLLGNTKNINTDTEAVAFFRGDGEITEGMRAEIESYIEYKKNNPLPEGSGLPENFEKLDAELIKRLNSLSPDELARVDAFVQGLLANREV